MYAIRSYYAAEAMGIPTASYKLKVFVISAAFAAVAGVLLTHYNGGIGPSESSVMKSVRYLAIVAIGGMANLWGALSMSLVLNYLSLRGYFGTYDDAVFGTILVITSYSIHYTKLYECYLGLLSLARHAADTPYNRILPA